VLQAVISAGLEQIAHLSSELHSLPSLVPDNQLGGRAVFRIQVSRDSLAISPPGTGGEGQKPDEKGMKS
jgi:hypothetical protein